MYKFCSIEFICNFHHREKSKNYAWFFHIKYQINYVKFMKWHIIKLRMSLYSYYPFLGSSGNQAQAQAPPPVPLQRTAPARRSRNEYVNMPLNSNQQLSTAVNPQQHQAVNSSQPSGPVNGHTDMSSLISSSSPDSSIQTGPPPHHQQQQPPPLPPHKHQEVPNYVNTSEANAMQQVWPLMLYKSASRIQEFVVHICS